jgi:hypothetical protein
VKGIWETKLLIAWNQAQQSFPGPLPAKIDYRKAKNMYRAKYGNLEWEKMLGSSRLMSPYNCVNELVNHICKESECVMKDTAHEEAWVFYHDGLSLMTVHETMEWIKKTFGEKGESYYSRWILPENELHSDDAAMKAYLFRPHWEFPREHALRYFPQSGCESRRGKACCDDT